MRKLQALPGWLMVRLICPFLPVEHPWKKRKFTLKDWYEHRTLLSRTLDEIMWCNLIVLIFLAAVTYKGITV